MKTKITILRASLHSRKFMYHVHKFFRVLKTKSNYMCSQIVLVSESDKYPVGERCFLNLRNNSEIKSYKLSMLEQYNKLREGNMNNEDINRIVFYYYECSKKDYNDNVENNVN